LLGVALIFYWYRQVPSSNIRLREEMRKDLQTKLDRVRRDFNGDLADAVNALYPQTLGFGHGFNTLERTILARPEQDLRIFRRIAIAIPGEYLIRLRMFDMKHRRFIECPWPEDWKGMQAELSAQLRHVSSASPVDGLVFERGAASGGIVFELNVPYLRDTLLPEILQHDLGADGRMDYHVAVFEVNWGTEPTRRALIYGSERIHDNNADAYVSLLQPYFHTLYGPRWHRGGEPEYGLEVSRWVLYARHKAGGIRGAVTLARWRGFVLRIELLLIALTGIALLLVNRRRSATSYHQ
jgi:hypothetical protein